MYIAAVTSGGEDKLKTKNPQTIQKKKCQDYLVKKSV